MCVIIYYLYISEKTFKNKFSRNKKKTMTLTFDVLSTRGDNLDPEGQPAALDESSVELV